MAWWQILLALNALIGGSFFVYIWNYSERHRQDNWILEKKAISMCRKDVSRWNKYKMLLGSMTIAIPRFLAYFLILLTTVIALK